MGSILLLGFLIGLKHAVEADHIAAVASLTGRSRGARAAAGVAMAWGLGHTLTLILVGLLVIILGVVLSEQIALYLELAVGIMLCWLGYDVLKRLIKERIHFHFHNHTDAQYGFIRHFHAHSHTHKETHFRADHDHNHLHASNRTKKSIRNRAFLVGLIHGMAGSSALILLTLGEINSPGKAILYITLFGLGTMFGMMLLSLIISFPLKKMANSLTWLHNTFSALAGFATIGLGVWLIYQIGFVEGLITG